MSGTARAKKDRVVSAQPVPTDTAASAATGAPPQRDIGRQAAKATAAGLAVVVLAFGIWQVRSVVVLLLLALTFAAAMRPGVEWLQKRHVPESVAILVFFLAAGGIIILFFWIALPPAIHEVERALNQTGKNGTAVRNSTGVKHDVLIWLNQHLGPLPSGKDLIHPVATYGQKATDVLVGIFFTLAATWYWVSERDSLIRLLTALTPESKRPKARETFLFIDHRLGSYTRVKFAMIFVIGALLAAGFYLVGLDYWLLAGGFVSFVEIVPVIGPFIGALFVLAIGLPQSLHVALMSLLVVVVVRTFQSYLINPHLAGHTSGLSPLVTIVSVSVVGLIFGGFAVILAIPVTSAVQTLIDVFVLDHDPPPERQPSHLQRSTDKAPPKTAPVGR
jgi:predicted PurR-regulated permease PerM